MWGIGRLWPIFQTQTPWISVSTVVTKWWGWIVLFPEVCGWNDFCSWKAGTWADSSLQPLHSGSSEHLAPSLTTTFIPVPSFSLSSSESGSHDFVSSAPSIPSLLFSVNWHHNPSTWINYTSGFSSASSSCWGGGNCSAAKTVIP